MTKVVPLHYIVTTRENTYTFLLEVHRSETPSEQLIEAHFYENLVGHVHGNVHHEMKIVTSPVGQRLDLQHLIHIHRHEESGELFICNTCHVPELALAELICKVWCVGTIYTMLREEDFVPLADAHPQDFLEFMATKHGIQLIE